LRSKTKGSRVTFASSRLGSGTGTFTLIGHEHEHEHEHDTRARSGSGIGASDSVPGSDWGTATATEGRRGAMPYTLLDLGGAGRDAVPQRSPSGAWRIAFRKVSRPRCSRRSTVFSEVSMIRAISR
jgi:hypothetical protein